MGPSNIVEDNEGAWSQRESDQERLATIKQGMCTIY